MTSHDPAFLHRLQQTNLQLLCYFRDFCQAHHLRFYLCGGGCIGAVRDGGFIPWDDDVDVFMPRPDYETLKQIWNTQADPRYYCQCSTADCVDRVPFLTVRDLQTTCVKREQADLDIPHGVALDVLPLDGCPSGFARKKQKLWALLFMLFNTSRVPENHGRLVTLGGKILLSMVPRKRRFALSKRLEQKMTQWEFGSTPLVTELCSGPHYLQMEYPYSVFADAKQISFAGQPMPVPADADGYLRRAFGDYMTPPPPEQQVPHHDFVYCNLELPAAEYANLRRQSTQGMVLEGEALHRLQAKTLELFKRLEQYCKQHGLRMYLCGGGCIGAVREQGFIPWDDDLDIFMPRPDYERLCSLLEQEQPQGLCCQRTGTSLYTRLQFAAVSDEQTTFIKLRQQDLELSHGIRIDVLPLDGCPDSRFARKLQIFRALLRSMYIVGEPHTSKGKALELISRFLLWLHPTYESKLRAAARCERKMTRYPFDKSQKVTELCTWFQYMRNEYPTEWFSSAVELPFEHTTVSVPAGYDGYLRMAFGDYMTPPPPEQRIPKHEIAYCDIDNPYHVYKGLYYCTNGTANHRKEDETI